MVGVVLSAVITGGGTAAAGSTRCIIVNLLGIAIERLFLIKIVPVVLALISIRVGTCIVRLVLSGLELIERPRLLALPPIGICIIGCR